MSTDPRRNRDWLKVIYGVIFGSHPAMPHWISVDAAGRLLIGDSGVVSSRGVTIAVVPVVTAGIYVAGDCVGGRLDFANAAAFAGGGGVVKSAIIVDDAGQDAGLELWLFSTTFASPGDTVPWAGVAEAVLETQVGWITTADGLWAAAGTASACAIEVSQRYDCVGTTLFGQLVVPADTPTFAAVDDITVILGLLQD